VRITVLGLLVAQALTAGYQYQASVAIPAPSSGSLTNFTAVISGTNALLKTVANSGQIQHTVTRVGQTVPADLILSSDKAGASLYAWGWDFYDGTAGSAKIWVLIPTYSASTTIYVSFGNSAVSTYQGGSVGSEFDSSTNVAMHAANGTTLSLADSTSNAQTASNYGSSNASATTGEIDGAAYFNGSAGITLPDSALTTPSTFTISLWFKRNGAQPTYGRLMEKGDSDNPPYSTYDILFNGSDSTSLVYEVGFSDGTPFGVATATAAIADNTWYKADETWNDATKTLTGYLNGVFVASATSAKTLNSSAGRLQSWGTAIASNNIANAQLTGSLDEMRFSATVRSAAWLATEYSNQSSPPAMSAFVTLAGSQIFVF